MERVCTYVLIISDWSSTVCSSDRREPYRERRRNQLHHGDAGYLSRYLQPVCPLAAYPDGSVRQPRIIFSLQKTGLDGRFFIARFPRVSVCDRAHNHEPINYVGWVFRSEERRVWKECVRTC